MTTTHTTKASSKTQTRDGDSPVQDVSDAEPTEVVDEMTRRATAAGTGGGAFPEDLLVKNYVGNEQRMDRTQPAPADEEPAEPAADEKKS
jgi:hypothetical protein